MGKDEALAVGIDHVQVAIPVGGEEQARQFYGEALGLEETPKPAALAGRGGVWYRLGDQALHLGIEEPFQPQRKGHPALRAPSIARVRARLAAAQIVAHDDVALPGYDRVYTYDPFGNKIEFIAKAPGASEATASERYSNEIKARVREAFGRTAEAYVTSETHRAGDDLATMVEWAAPQPSDWTLDVSTGGGHTALAFASYVARVTASDLTPRMLATARSFLARSGATNVDYVIADAEQLPFLDDTFDLVTVRIAPHHYADIRQAVREMARVLVPSGRLLVVDNCAPEDPALDHFVNDWDKRRDPSHVREYTPSEWRSFVAEAGLRLTQSALQRKTHPFADWTARMQLDTAARDALAADMLAAPPEARRYFEVIEDAGAVVQWTSDYALLGAVKPV